MVCPGYALAPSESSDASEQELATEELEAHEALDKIAVGEPSGPSMPLSTFTSTEQVAMDYFFGKVLPRMPGHCLDYVPNLLASNQAFPLLERAAVAVAFSFTSLDPSYAYFKPLAIDCYNKATQEANSLITQEAELYNDQLLLLLFLFLTWEVSSPLT